MENYNLEAKIKIIQGRKQNKNKTPQELENMALEEIKKESLKVDWVGLTKNEEKIAQKSFENYVNNHHIESFNDLEDLKTLVYNALLEDRIKTKIFELTESKDANGNAKPEIPNKYILDSLTSLQKQNLDLKQKLGLNESKQEGWIQFWSRICKKINTHAVEHRGEFTFKCPSCGKMALILRKISDSNVFDFRMFRGTFVYNETVMELINEGKLDYVRAATIFGCSKDYIEKMYEEVYLREKKHVKK